MGKVSITLPDAVKAHAYRESIRSRAEWALDEASPTEGWVEQSEGSQRRRDYFSAHRLCDGSTDIDSSTFDMLRDCGAVQHNPPHHVDWRKRLLDDADKLASSGKLGADIESIRLTVLALSVDELPGYLARQAPVLFEVYPKGSLWFIETDFAPIIRFEVTTSGSRMRGRAKPSAVPCSAGRHGTKLNMPSSGLECMAAR